MWIREYPGSFQNRLVSSFFKWVPKYVLFLAKLIGEGRPFWNGKAYRLILWTISYLHVGIILTIVKVFIILFLLVPWEYREHPGNFQNKSVSSAFNWVSRYIIFLVKLKGTERKSHCKRLFPRALGCHKRCESLFFCKIWNNPTSLLFFITLRYK